MYGGTMPSKSQCWGRRSMEHTMRSCLRKKTTKRPRDVPLGRVLVQNPQHRVNQVEKLHIFSPDPWGGGTEVGRTERGQIILPTSV